MVCISLVNSVLSPHSDGDATLVNAVLSPHSDGDATVVSAVFSPHSGVHSPWSMLS